MTNSSTTILTAADKKFRAKLKAQLDKIIADPFKRCINCAGYFKESDYCGRTYVHSWTKPTNTCINWAPLSGVNHE